MIGWWWWCDGAFRGYSATAVASPVTFLAIVLMVASVVAAIIASAMLVVASVTFRETALRRVAQLVAAEATMRMTMNTDKLVIFWPALMASPLPPMRLLLSLTQKRLCLKYWGRNRNTDSIQPIFFAANILPNLSMSYNTNHYSFTVSIFLLYYCCLTLHGLFLMVEVGHYRLCGNILHLPVFLHLVTKLYDAERVSQNNEESEEKPCLFLCPGVPF